MPKKKMKKDERVNVNLDYGEEVTVAESPGGRVQVRVPEFPEPCNWVRVVEIAGSDTIELAYWCSDEWCESPEQAADVMGAIMGAIVSVNCGTYPVKA